jgi:hypothetical protein
VRLAGEPNRPHFTSCSSPNQERRLLSMEAEVAASHPTRLFLGTRQTGRFKGFLAIGEDMRTTDLAVLH